MHFFQNETNSANLSQLKCEKVYLWVKMTTRKKNAKDDKRDGVQFSESGNLQHATKEEDCLALNVFLSAHQTKFGSASEKCLFNCSHFYYKIK